jgi:hypothetical protein
VAGGRQVGTRCAPSPGFPERLTERGHEALRVVVDLSQHAVRSWGLASLDASRPFDAPGARYDHRDGRCTFEVLIEDYDLVDDPALARLADIVHAADIADDVHSDPIGPGLLAIGLGGLDVEHDDQRLLERATFVYDALYAWCDRQHRVGA